MARYTFFDFDGTLTRHDSFTGFIRHVRGLHGLLWVLVKSASAIIFWKAGFKPAIYAKLKMFSEAFRGMPQSEFRARGEEYAEKVDKMLRRETYDKLREAVSRGDKVAIVSASLGDWIRPWAMRNGVECVISTEAETDPEGRLTGAFSTPNCSHTEKRRRILEAYPQLAREREQHRVTAYGDSDGDAEMLAFADRGVNVRDKR